MKKAVSYLIEEDMIKMAKIKSAMDGLSISDYVNNLIEKDTIEIQKKIKKEVKK